ncbi:MAG: hypothetical protein IKL65_05710 [Bacilli bacterium]|nr:hypothetical protein [Bacilli bacterium]
MTEEEAKKALFDLHFEYMMNSPKERLKKYEEYKENRARIRHELAQAIRERKEKELKMK